MALAGGGCSCRAILYGGDKGADLGGCDRKANTKPDSYTNKLFEGGDNKILQKIGEEAVEVVMACIDDEPDEIAGEVADLLYHTLVAIAHHDVDLRAVYQKLQSRR